MLSVILLISLGAAEFKIRDMGELKVVWEREFDFDVQDAIVDSFGNLRVLIGKDKIVWLDVKGKEIKEYKFEKKYHKVRLSDNRKYIGVHEIWAKPKGYLNMAGIFKVFDINGNELWSVTIDPHPEDMDIYLAPNGEYAVGLPMFEEPLFILESNKVEIDKEPPTKNSWRDISFSSDGKYFVVTTLSGRIKFFENKNLKWNKKINCLITGVKVLEEEICIVCISSASREGQKIIFLDMLGNIASDLKLKGGKGRVYFYFNDNIKILTLAFMTGEFYLIDLEKHNLIYTSKIIKGAHYVKKRRFSYAIKSMQGVGNDIIFVGYSFGSPKRYFHILNFDKKILFSYEIIPSCIRLMPISSNKFMILNLEKRKYSIISIHREEGK